MYKLTLALLQKVGAPERILRRYRRHCDVSCDPTPDAIARLSGGKRGDDTAWLSCLLPDPKPRARWQRADEDARRRRDLDIAQALVSRDKAIAEAEAVCAASTEESEDYRRDRQSEGKGLGAMYRPHVAAVSAEYRLEKADAVLERNEKVIAARTSYGEEIQASWKLYWFVSATAFADSFAAIDPAELSVASGRHADIPHMALASVRNKGVGSPHFAPVQEWIRGALQDVPEGETWPTQRLLAHLGVMPGRDTKRLSNALCALRNSGGIEDCYRRHETRTYMGKLLIEWHRPQRLGSER